MYLNFKVVGINQCFNLCITNVFPVKIISMVLLMHSVLKGTSRHLDGQGGCEKIAVEKGRPTVKPLF